MQRNTFIDVEQDEQVYELAGWNLPCFTVDAKKTRRTVLAVLRPNNHISTR